MRMKEPRRSVTTCQPIMHQCAAAVMMTVLGLSVTFAQAPRGGDPDNMMKGGALPAGWMARLDSGSTKPDGVSVMTMGTGLHFKTGPAGIYYRQADATSGSYAVHATFTQMEPAEHPEAVGIFIGGSNLAAATQKYTYFLVRQDGQFLIKRRDGAQTPNIMDWTASPAVKKTDAATKGVNALSIVVTPDKVRFLVNGTEVHSATPAQVDAAGVAGLRVNHNLNVHVENFGVK
jgi:hypothetical protein